MHRIGARAERRVTNELINAFKKVTGKENILFSIAEAALGAPDEAVREVVFPAVAGGQQTLRELVHEFKTKGPVYRRTVQTTLRSSCTGHYRRGLIARIWSTGPTPGGRRRVTRMVYEVVTFQAAARTAAMQGDLGRRRRFLAQPRRGPARGL
ncbi:MAG: hypothetical protein M3Y33_03115 [Actinomycetota bacterium]|nr:hypothetical protein [Actinomycetota bacterium]